MTEHFSTMFQCENVRSLTAAPMLGAIYVLHLKREDLQVPSCGESYSIGVQDLSHPSVVHTTCHGKSTCFGNAKLEPFLALPPASPATHSKRSNSCDII